MNQHQYRLIKSTKASGFVTWVIQRKLLFWWEFVDCYIDESKAREVLDALRSGVAPERREVVG